VTNSTTTSSYHGLLMLVRERERGGGVNLETLVDFEFDGC